jgi:hypothetical protein
MRIPGLLLILLALLPTYSLADNHGATQCTYDNLIRRVVIMSEPGVSVPCEVHYYKDVEAPGVDQVLWSADSQAGYCEEKAAELVANLEGWGWECGPAEAMPAQPAMPAAPEQPEQPATPEMPAEPMQPEAPEEIEEAMDDTSDLVPADDRQ